MKKILSILIICLFPLFLMSCKPKIVKEFERFLNAESGDFTLSVEVQSTKVDLFNFVFADGYTEISTAEDIGNLMYYKMVIDPEGNMYYNISNKSMYILSDGSKENQLIDIKMDLEDIVIEKDKIMFKIDIEKLLESIFFDIQGMEELIPIDSDMDLICFFKDGKVSKIYFKIEEVEVILYVNSYNNNEKVKVPSMEERVVLEADEVEEYLTSGSLGTYQIRDELLADISTVSYAFRIENNVYVCDSKYLYKFDSNFENVLGKIDLGYSGVFHCVKGKYLYVSATETNPDLTAGSITKIDLETFTCVDQMILDFSPFSIGVKDDTEILVSIYEGSSSTTKKVNLKTKETTGAFSAQKKSYIFYLPEEDGYLSLAQFDCMDQYRLLKYKQYRWQSSQKYYGLNAENLFYYNLEDGVFVSEAGAYIICESEDTGEEYESYWLSLLGIDRRKEDVKYVLLHNDILYSIYQEEDGNYYIAYNHIEGDEDSYDRHRILTSDLDIAYAEINEENQLIIIKRDGKISRTDL